MKKQQKYCHECKQLFSCGGNCWCMDFPPIFSLTVSEDCLCPSCLKNRTINQIEAYLKEITPQKRKEIKALPKTNSLIEGIDYIINENGLYVFSKWYLLKKGKCCQNGCLNCPY